jgi:diaminopimelate epimerase
MNYTTTTIIGTTEHGVPSGNYDGSSLEWSSNAVKAVAYYLGQGSFQTVTIQVTGFQGRIIIEGSLSDQSDTTSWVELYDYNFANSTITDYHPETIIGNFVWMRARVIAFTQGVINGVTISY